jgi:hypothetical protein
MPPTSNTTHKNRAATGHSPGEESRPPPTTAFPKKPPHAHTHAHARGADAGHAPVPVQPQPVAAQGPAAPRWACRAQSTGPARGPRPGRTAPRMRSTGSRPRPGRCGTCPPRARGGRLLCTPAPAAAGLRGRWAPRPGTRWGASRPASAHGGRHAHTSRACTLRAHSVLTVRSRTADRMGGGGGGRLLRQER